jgi:hypothetical protein
MPTFEEMSDFAEESLLVIPERWRALLNNLAVVIEDWPAFADPPSPVGSGRAGASASAEAAADGAAGRPDDFSADEEDEGEMLGMLEGPALTEQSINDPYSFPTRLVLFRGVIAEEAADTGETVARVVRETVWHEVAHYFGHDEDGAYALETKWESEWQRLHPDAP